MSTFEEWNSELYHHGIKGMRWGVRRYQNADGSYTDAGKERYGINIKAINRQLKKGIRSANLRQAHTIPKGTTIYRTTDSEVEANKTGSTYVSYLDVDRNHYNGGWIRQQGKTGAAYEHSFQLKEDLNVPGRKEVETVIAETLKKNPGLVSETVEKWWDIAVPKDSMERIEITSMWQDYKDSGKYKNPDDYFRKEYIEPAIKKFGDMPASSAAFYTAQTFGLNDKVKKLVIDELSKRGYNAMTDEASVGGQNGWGREGGDPLIIFNREKSLGEETGNSRITYRKEQRADRKDRSFNYKARRNTSGSWSAL